MGSGIVEAKVLRRRLNACCVPRSDENHDDSQCEDEGEGTAVAGGETSQRPNVVLTWKCSQDASAATGLSVSHSRNRGLATGLVAVDSRAMRQVLLDALRQLRPCDSFSDARRDRYFIQLVLIRLDH
jgi:hypothetical protein